jgi:hypothetical protein
MKKSIVILVLILNGWHKPTDQLLVFGNVSLIDGTGAPVIEGVNLAIKGNTAQGIGGGKYKAITTFNGHWQIPPSRIG